MTDIPLSYVKITGKAIINRETTRVIWWQEESGMCSGIVHCSDYDTVRLMKTSSIKSAIDSIRLMIAKEGYLLTYSDGSFEDLANIGEVVL
jgi:hypothetical protein